MRAGERASRILISIGGIGTIVAVSLVLVFLVYVVVPLFRPESTTQAGSPRAATWAAAADFVLTDEYQVMGAAAFLDRALILTFRLDTGEAIREIPLFGGRVPRSHAMDVRQGRLIAGFQDGSTSVARLGFATEYLEEQQAPQELRALPPGGIVQEGDRIVERTPIGQLRAQRFSVEEEAAAQVFEGAAVVLVDIAVLDSGPVVAALSADGTLSVDQISLRRNLLTGEVTTTLTGGHTTVPQVAQRGLPEYLSLTGIGDNVYLIWRDGTLLRFDTRIIEAPREAERVRLIAPGSGAQVTAVESLIGDTTMLVGDSTGAVRSWFRVKPPQAPTPDGAVLTNAETFPGTGSPVSSIAISQRKRMFAAGYLSGAVRLYYVTSSQLLSENMTGSAVRGLSLAPKDDGLWVFADSGEIRSYRIDAPHPEVTLRTLFSPVWYEGNGEAQHIWQSSSGTDAFEPKFGLIPLIFGTLKATFYSLLFGVPIALAAAVYTSEFLHPRARARIKPSIEMMASLPSVVLGFLAAIVVAPFVESVVPAVMACFVVLPMMFLLSGYVVQTLPRRSVLRLNRVRMGAIALLVIPAGIALATLVGPWLERLLFAGDMKLWLDGQAGDGGPGWFLMLLPVSGVAAMLGVTRWLTPRLRRAGSDRETALVELAKFVGGVILAVALAWLASRLLVLMGLDSRGTAPVLGQLLGTYVQRNSLVVGFIMGFAIIPIIYTLADDALTSVPEHLRAASLAAGATPWQTTARIVVPTAMSGLFSAVMIGLGRAVGETMIVLMATGNTPVLDGNIFNGFRTLSANIAVELPEAVAGSTHYRTLFLAALVLFLMTFAVNTVAELVRIRFRKRAFQL